MINNEFIFLDNWTQLDNSTRDLKQRQPLVTETVEKLPVVSLWEYFL